MEYIFRPGTSAVGVSGPESGSGGSCRGGHGGGGYRSASTLTQDDNFEFAETQTAILEEVEGEQTDDTPASYQSAGHSVDVEEVETTLSTAIFTFALEGNALKAIELTRELAPTLLEENKDLYFDLLSLHFVSLVRSRKCTEALEFAQTMLTPFGKIPKYVEKLEDFMALLAYEEPEKSPMFHLLSQEYRENVACSLNRAILAHFNLPAFSSMERLIQQATVVMLYLNKEPGKGGPSPFSLKAFLKN